MKTIITPPDIIYSSDPSILLINPTTEMSTWINKIIDDIPDTVNIYLFPCYCTDIKWLLNTIKLSAAVIVDSEQCSPNLNQWLAYIISHRQTYYRAINKNNDWGLISNRRVADFFSINLQDIL